MRLFFYLVWVRFAELHNPFIDNHKNKIRNFLDFYDSKYPLGKPIVML